jgi:two-component system NtrC family sensor kinase
MEQAPRSHEQIQDELDGLRRQNAGLQEQRDGLRKQRDGLQEQRDELQEQRDGLLKQQDELRKQLEDSAGALAELARERSFTQALLNSVRVPIYVVEPGTYRIITCNDVFLREYGVSLVEAIGSTCYELTRRRNTPCAASPEACPLLSAAETGEPSMMDFEYSTNGETIDLECTATPLKDENGKVSRVIHVIRDITHRKRIEEKLRETNQELSISLTFMRNLINSSVDAIIASDLTGRILVFNEAAQGITGYSEEEAFHQIDIRDIYTGDGAKDIMKKLRSNDLGGKGKLKSLECNLLHKDGSSIPISLSAAIVYEGNKEVSTCGFFYDLREKKAMEAELDKTRVQLLQAEKMASIGKLAAGVAHQLNNPLSGITLFAHILTEEYDLDDNALSDVGRILANAERCRDTVKELLKFARQTAYEIKPADLNQALQRALFLLENQALFQNIRIEKQFAPDLPMVPADIQQLGHVFMNIILNAADATDGNGRITVRTSLSTDKKNVLVEISDTGPGIEPEDLAHLFEPFFTTKEEGKGTGLGLSVAYGVIENHDGQISARNLKEGGACFTIELPLQNQS